MKRYENESGFTPKRCVYIEELDATLVDMLHERSGARLLFLDRADENKTFAIGFKTIPTDDTGVFHILEHSVLSGSEKYPVKDPLSELMKGSLYTYVNAFTYPDKTLYPVSSKNGKAFLDLISVYMDAVFHPLALKNENIFLCEGRRFEPAPDGSLIPNGVVYNEMKGAYSSPEELVEHYLSKLLFAGGAYAADSGGFPESILRLGYDDFKSAHKNFYSPANSCIFLDGRIDLPSVLKLLDSALPDCDEAPDVPKLTLGDVDTEERVEYYGIDGGESPDDRGRLVLGYRGFPHADAERTLAVTAILDAIADGNSSPIKRKILASGLCENMYVYYSSGAAVGTLGVQFLNVKEGKNKELTELFDSVMSELLSAGLDNERISAALSVLEFKTREADFGAYPKGMVYMSAALEYAFLGEEPECAFTYNTLFKGLKEKLGTPYFDGVLSELLSRERVTLRLLPRADYVELSEKRTAEQLAEYRALMSDEELSELGRKHASFLEWQATPDTDADLASIPTLSLSDITEPAPDVETCDMVLLGSRVLLHAVPSSGIAYLDLLFDASDVTGDELFALRLLSRTLPDMDTELGSAEDFGARVKKKLGDLGATLLPVKCGEEVKLYLRFSVSLLADNLPSALELLTERLYMTRTDNAEAVSRRAKQMLTHSKLSFSEDGSSYALTRTLARYDDYSALREKLFGYDFHSYLLRFDAFSPSEREKVVSSFAPLLERILKRERLTLAVAFDAPLEIAESTLSVIPTGGASAGPLSVERPDMVDEGIAVPAAVGYAACGTNFLPDGYIYDGSFAVASTMLVYEHLWGEVRLSGGAYDTGFIARANSGSLALYSYRDPTPERSVALFSGLGERLRKLVKEGVDITKYIISSVGAQDTASTPRSASSAATLLYISGKTDEDTKRIRREILATDKNKILAFADMLDALSDGATSTLVAPRERILAAGVKRILDI
ncbi:MAG: insulinase family protein [Clostridia bacterium]|nr:insulinase family protein [Clostridia bacterium]